MRNKICCPKVYAIFIAFLLGSVVMAQGIMIKGKVSAKSDGMPLPGVSILEVGTVNGTITDIDGNYQLRVLDGKSVLSFNFLSYSKQNIEVGNKTIINVELEEESSQLDELIVIGYGVQRKSDKTGAVAQVTSEELNGGSLTDPLQALQGKTAGVMITKKGGDPNSGFSVRIRGASGFDSGTEPLYVIDGIRGADPTTIAPEDIESYNILKDAASTAIYGSQGANGVIIITTKSGVNNLGKVEFTAKSSMDFVAKKLDLLTGEEYRAFVTENNLSITDGGASTDWQNEIYRPGLTQNYNLSFSGGSEKSSYSANLSHADWQGIMLGTAKQRTIGKLNINHKALNDKLVFDATILGAFENNDYENYDGFDKDDIIYQAISRNPTDPVYNAEGNYDKTQRAFNYENPLAVINGIDNIRDAKRFLGDFSANYDITNYLSTRINIGYLRNDHESSYFRPKGIYASADNGSGSKRYENSSFKLFEWTGNYKKSYDNHNLNADAGYTWGEWNWNGFFAQAKNPQSNFLRYNNLGSFIDITSSSIGSWAGMNRLIGFFGRIQYNYLEKYYLSGSLRRDGSSKFGANNKWAWFPTVATSWNLDREDFIKNIDAISQMKLRLSYGVAGNQEIGSYNSQIIFRSNGPATNPETGEQVTTFGPDHNENPNLKWESTSEVNLGLDFGFFKNKVSGTLEIYTKTTDDLLGRYSVPVPPNLASITYVNTGSILNQGIELYIQAHLIDHRNFSWKTTLNASHNKTTILSLGDYVEGEVRKDGYLTGRGLIGDINYVTGNIEGEEMGAFYLPVFYDLSSDGKFRFISKTGGITREINDAQRQIVGTPAPYLEIGWSNSLRLYKDWSLDISLRSMLGNDVYNATRMFFDNPVLITKDGLNALPDAIDWAEKGRIQQTTIADIYVEDGSFLKIDYISLGYNVPLKKNNYIKAVKISLSGNNIYTFTNYSGVDPETTMMGLSFGIDQYNVYPKTRTITFGVNATF